MHVCTRGSSHPSYPTLHSREDSHLVHSTGILQYYFKDACIFLEWATTQETICTTVRSQYLRLQMERKQKYALYLCIENLEKNYAFK
jgi:hypothetical protein